MIHNTELCLSLIFLGLYPLSKQIIERCGNCFLLQVVGCCGLENSPNKCQW